MTMYLPGREPSKQNLIPLPKRIEQSNTDKEEPIETAIEDVINEPIPPKTKKKKIKKSVKQNVIDFSKSLIVTLLVLFGTLNFLVRPIKIDGVSMSPTLKDGELGLANVLGAKIGDINRFDIVIIRIPESNRYLIKRVIGMPGDTLSYKNDKLYINGNPIDEDFLDSDYRKSYSLFTSDIDEITLGDDEYYCLGDNRPNSMDSRVYGAFDKSQIVAKQLIFF